MTQKSRIALVDKSVVMQRLHRFATEPRFDGLPYPDLSDSSFVGAVLYRAMLENV